MTTLSYATPTTFPPRYWRLALGGGLLTIAGVILVAWPLISSLIPRVYLSHETVYWLQACSSGLAYLLYIPAAAAFATFRRGTSRTFLIVFTSLAALHFSLMLTVNLGAHGMSFSPPLSATALLILVAYVVAEFVFLTLLVTAVVFIIRLRILPITIVAMLCFTPTLAMAVFRTLFTLLHYLANLDLFANNYLQWILRYSRYGSAVDLVFWLMLTIVAIVLAVRSRAVAEIR